MILINGKAEQNLSCLDRGLHYGDGLFETLLHEGGLVKYWSLHWRRLIHGCERLNLPLPDEDKLLADVEQVTNGLQSAVVKIIYTRGVTGRGYAYAQCRPNCIVMDFPIPQYPRHNSEQGVELYLCNTRLAHQPLLAGVKHLNRLENVLARNEWQDAQIAEGLLCCMDGNVIEGTMSNIFMVKDGMLNTPDLSRCGVKGITRQRIMQMAAEQHIAVSEKQISLEALAQADEVFVCNTIIGIWPVKKVGSMEFMITDNNNIITRKFQNSLF